MRYSRRVVAGFLLLGLPAILAVAQDDSGAKTKMVQIGPAVYPLPVSWDRQRPRSQMRLLQYGVPLAEGDQGRVVFVVFYFGRKGAGSVQANIDRWTGMFQDRAGEPKVDTFEVDGMKITTLDIAGTYKDKPAPFLPQVTLRENYRMLAAVVETGEEGPYFFRLVGPVKSVAAQLQNWSNLLKKAVKRPASDAQAG